jgi:putative transposase
VIEAALEAELDDHLDGGRGVAPRHRGGNSRNGSRTKTVRTIVGAVEIEAPRDRRGTFEPVTLGKWQREGACIDRVLLPLAAKGTPPDLAQRLLSLVYPRGISEEMLRRIVSKVHHRMSGWHEQDLGSGIDALRVHMSVLRGDHGQMVGLPFATVVGAGAADLDVSARFELLSLHTVPPERFAAPWGGVLEDLRRRGVTRVRAVAGDGSASLREAVCRAWPGAEIH